MNFKEKSHYAVIVFIIYACITTGVYGMIGNTSLIHLTTPGIGSASSVSNISQSSLYSTTMSTKVNLSNAAVMPSFNTKMTPPHLHNYMSKGTQKLNNCSEALSQIPDDIVTMETDSVGTSLVNISASNELQLSVTVLSPKKLISILSGSFNITISDNITQHLTLVRPVDIDSIYDKTKVIASLLTIEVECTTYSVKYNKIVNVSVVDIDDNSPKFNVKTKGECLVPVYKADVIADYVGEVYPKPSTIHAVDGDTLLNNNVTYSVLYGEPLEYMNFFTFDKYDATINKTSKVSDTDPHSFVLAIQATEESAERRSSMALLSISLYIVMDGSTSVTTKVNESVLLILRILSIIVILAFIIGLIIIIRHRYRRRKQTKPMKKLAYQTNDILIIEDLENETSLVEWRKTDVIDVSGAAPPNIINNSK